MKKIKFHIIIFVIMVLFLLPTSVFADGDISVSTSTINITKGKTVSFMITASNSAGRVDISSSNANIASVSSSTLFLDMESSKVNVTGNSVGSTYIKVYIFDATTFDDEDLTGKTYTIKVNVLEPSNNNNLKSLNVNGFELIKIDDNNYTLSVSNGITDIDLNAVTEDSNASISGDGLHELNIGENNIEVIVTSESGLENIINILVTRRDGYYIDDLTTLLDSTETKEIDIIIEHDTKITSSDLLKIRDNEKIVRFNFYDKEKKLIYSWTLNGKKITTTEEFSTAISNESEFSDKIDALTNSADGIFVDFSHSDIFPGGTSLKLYVGDKFVDGKKLNSYYYDVEKMNLQLARNNLIVRGGYITFDIEEGRDLFITVPDIIIKSKDDSFTTNVIWVITTIALSIVVYFIIRFFKSKRINENSNYFTQDNYSSDN